MNTSKLEMSPMFQLSLGSKELFHTNFLYWLWKAEPEFFWNVMNKFGIDCGKIHPDDLVVRREWENFDLSIVKYDNAKITDIVAVIENKVKSLPRKEQLIEYDDKIKKILKIQKTNEIKTTRILLSLLESNFDKEGWTSINYKVYKDALPKELDNPYHNSILQDYKNLIVSLLDFKEQWIGNEEFLSNMRYEDIFDEEKSKEAINLRINDLRQKMIYSKMFSMIKNELKEYNPKTEIGAEQMMCANDVKLAIGTTMTRATGLIDAKVKIKVRELGNEECLLGIQLQGKQYRHYIETVDHSIDKSDNDIANLLKKIFNHGESYGAKRETLCSYKNKNGIKSFYYVYQIGEEDVCKKSIGDVIRQMVKDVTFLMEM